MSKMCSLSKIMRSTNGDTYINLMNKPKYYCKRCGRVANDKEYLCRPFPLFENTQDDLKIKEVEIAVRRDGLQKHYTVDKQSEPVQEEISNPSSDSTTLDTHECNCTPEDNCGDNCDCKSNDNVVHVSDLFKNEDGTFSDQWVDESPKPNDDFPEKESTIEDFFVKTALHETKTKDKSIKKMKMSELKALIRKEIQKALDEK